MNNSENTKRKEAFRKTLKEFFRVLLATALLFSTIFYLGGFYKKKKQTYRCQAEEVVSKNQQLFFKGINANFSRGELQSNDFAHSYKHSIKLTKADPFGFNFIIPSADGDEDLWISVWRYNPDGQQKGKLICSANNFYQASDQIKLRQDSGWEKISMRAHLTQAVRNEKLQVYCMHEGEEPIYFDDLEIVLKRKDK